MHTQLSLFDLLPYSPSPHSPKIAHQQDPYWDKLVGEQESNDTHDAPKPDDCVGEQVAVDTPKVAHQHTHWLEKYWVERNQKKYYYWRYSWMEGRKIHRRYIGNVLTPLAKQRKQAVENAIALDLTPHEIKQLINNFCTIVQKSF